jgi:hypothetical protein
VPALTGPVCRRSRTAARYDDRVSDHTERLRELSERVAAAKEFL